MKYFSLNELTRSTTADKIGIDNTPSEEVKNNLETLVEKVLDPLRERFGKPILVNSGYRCPELNKAVGGSRTSDHMTGRSADITSGTLYGNKVLFDIIKNHLDFDQLIFERGDRNVGPAWVHVSYRSEEGNRKHVLYR